MVFLCLLCFLGQSSDFEIDFSKSDYDLFLNSTGVFVRQTNEDPEMKTIVYNSTKIEDFTVNLDIDLKFVESKTCLNIYADPLTVNLNLKIKYMSEKVLYPGICVHDKENSDNMFYNYYTITILSDTIFYYDMSDWSIGTIESYSLSNQLLSRATLSVDMSFYDSHAYICYKRTDCLKNFNIGPYDSYFIATDDSMLDKFIDNIYKNEYDSSFYILFGESCDFIKLTDHNFDEIYAHLVGITQNPVELKIDGPLCFSNVILTNVKFVKKDPNTDLELTFNDITIDDDTQNVFPKDGCTISSTSFNEYRTNTNPSQFESITSEKGYFYINPDFETNGDVSFYIRNDTIEVKNSKEETFVTVPVYKNYSVTKIVIEGDKNLNHHKIVIINGLTNLEESLEEDFEIYITECGQIPINFRDWNDEKLSNFKFVIYDETSYEPFITNTNSTYLKYDIENIPVLPDSPLVVICLSADTCSESEFAGNHVYQLPINGKDVDEVKTNLNNYLEAHTNITHLVLVLNDNLKNAELELPNLDELLFLSFVYHNNGKDPLPITLSSFPTTEQIDLEIIECQITVKTGVQSDIDHLFVSEKGGITGAESKDKINVKYIDISSKDETIVLSGNNQMKLIVKSGNSPHNIIFKEEGQFNCNVYIQAYDQNFIDFPVSFVEGQSTEKSNILNLRIINQERFIFSSIPTNIYTTVIFDYSDAIRDHIPPKSKDSQQVSICYNGYSCIDEDSEIIKDDNHTYLSSLTENDFISWMKLLNQDKNKIYKYIRLIFQNENDYEDVQFNQIPDQMKQVRLTTIEPEGEHTYLILNNKIETKNISSWLFERNVFLWRSNDDKFYYFNDVSSDSLDEDYVLEIFDDIYEHFFIETYHLPAELASVFNYLVHSNLVQNFGKILIEMTPIDGESNIKCTEDKVVLGKEPNAKEIENPVFTNMYLTILDDEKTKQTVKLNRLDTTIDQTNLLITKTDGEVTIDLQCNDKSKDGYFELNVYKMHNNIKITVNKNTCSNVEYYTIPYGIDDDTQQPPVTDNKLSSSHSFEFVNGGYKSIENGDTKLNSIPDGKIVFTQNYISISEAEGSGSGTPLYFVPYYENSKILIKENVKNYNIGVASDKSPRVIIEKIDNSLSFMNEIDEGTINVLFSKEKDLLSNTRLTFKEINNNHGTLKLYVPTSIDTVSFSNIKMSQESNINANKKGTTSNAKVLQDANPTILVTNSVTLEPKSTSTIQNLDLGGTLSIDDDSVLKLTGDVKFGSNSKIDLSIANSKINAGRKVIECTNTLNSMPKSIVVSLKTDDKNIDIPDLQIIGPISSANMCNEMGKSISSNKDLSYTCPETQGKIYLSVSLKKKKSKLNAGAIAGIVIGCVAAVAIVVGLTIFFIKRKKNKPSSSSEERPDEENQNE